MTVDIIKQGAVVATSKNLRSILAYARKSYVFKATVMREHEGASLYIQFDDGAECRTHFADFYVCLHFVESRAKRSWRLERVDNSKTYIAFYIPSSDPRAAIR